MFIFRPIIAMLNKNGPYFVLNFQNCVSNKSREGLFPEAYPQYKTGFVCMLPK